MLAAQPTTAVLDVLADAFEAAATTDLKMGLFTGDPTLTFATVLANLTPPAFTGYAQVAMTIGARRGNANGDIIIPLGMASFQPTAPVSPTETVTGAFILLDDTPDVLYFAEMLDTPWVVVDEGSALDVIWEVYIKADPVYGGVCTTCST